MGLGSSDSNILDTNFGGLLRGDSGESLRVVLCESMKLAG
jgi:hypothetical protein